MGLDGQLCKLSFQTQNIRDFSIRTIHDDRDELAIRIAESDAFELVGINAVPYS